MYLPAGIGIEWRPSLAMSQGRYMQLLIASELPLCDKND